MYCQCFEKVSSGELKQVNIIDHLIVSICTKLSVTLSVNTLSTDLNCQHLKSRNHICLTCMQAEPKQF